LLALVYELQWPVPGGQAAISDPEEFAQFVAAGRFPDDSLFYHHAKFQSRLSDVIDGIPAHQVTIIRDPYDVFVSLYFWEQERASRGLGRDRSRPRHVLYGKPIDDQDVLAYLADGFGRNRARATGWLHSGRAIPIRYEDLYSDPLNALRSLTDCITPVSAERLERAIADCRAEKMRQQDDKMKWHVREARVGDSREKLGRMHLEIFRTHHADSIRALGYEVR
jgi:hypothetical protein